jgi:uncharacterized phage protein gp47/JayE
MAELADIQVVEIDDAKQQILDAWSGMELPTDLAFQNGTLPAMALEAGARLWNKQSQIAVASKGLTLGELATGDALTRWSKSVYNHDRFPAENASWKVRVTCAAGSGPYELTDGAMVATDGTYTFRLVDSSSLGVSFPYTLATGSYVDVVFDAEVAGIDSGLVAVGAINRLVTTYTGVTISNLSLLSAGSDAESDAQLRQRNSTKWATLNSLTMVKDAYIYYARAADSLVRRVILIGGNPRGAFTLDVVIAGDAGVLGSDPVTAVSNALKARLIDFVADRLEVRSAIAAAQTLQGHVYYLSSFSESAVRIAIQVAVNNLAKELPIGGASYVGYGDHRVLRSQWELAITNAVVGDQRCVKLVTLTSPAEAVELDIDEVAAPATLVWGAGNLELHPVPA